MRERLTTPAKSEESTPFDGLTFHDLRHTCASPMIAAAKQAGAGQACGQLRS
jgi:hypothetical protein